MLPNVTSKVRQLGMVIMIVVVAAQSENPI
jgi:hypothetical protein